MDLGLLLAEEGDVSSLIKDKEGSRVASDFFPQIKIQTYSNLLIAPQHGHNPQPLPPSPL